MARGRRYLWSGAVLLVSTLALTLAGGQTRPRTGDTSTMHAFLERHWRRPLAPQGPAPTRFSAVERSLAPESCGVCHPAQFTDWKTTLHSRAMGPGVVGQLVELERTDPATPQLCRSCHAPLAEQQPTRPIAGGVRSNPAFDEKLQRAGLVCAACHVRVHQRFGPPRRDGSLGTDEARVTLPHNGVTRTPAFLDSEFCATCHQFAPDDLALNGKLLQNTYAEWKSSPAARRGVHCQNCHMPDRRHLWRGVHDAEMVRSGVEITLTTDRARYRRGEEVRATLRIVNSGVGHHFPTYVTPQVVVRVQLLDAEGRVLRRSIEQSTIGRDVALDLSREIADTRIPAGGSWTLDYQRMLDRPGLRLVATVTVFPDYFYSRFFEALLPGAGAGAPQIREALAATRRSPFEIFARQIDFL